MHKNYRTEKGSPEPLGSSTRESGTNFSLYAPHAKHIELHLFSRSQKKPFARVALHKTHPFWHVCIGPLPKETTYGYQIDGAQYLVHDPYAKDLSSSFKWNDRTKPYHPLGRIPEDTPFDWDGDAPLHLPMEELIIYEMHVRGFTTHPSSGVYHPGTFLGLIEKIPYLKSLGINAIELLPIFEFNECEFPLPRVNFWGYSTVNFFTPMKRFLNTSITEWKTLVKALHKAGIEVILDVVFNHTAEGISPKALYSFKGIDRASYYLLDSEGKDRNFSGTGNTVNCNHPIVRKLILDSLRYWVSEMHVDGFRFDLASILTRGENGEPLESPPLILDISIDPILAQTKLIAEAWDAAGLYQVGTFPKWGHWYEWNGKYRDAVRAFIKGDEGASSAFATAICGSQNLYGQHGKTTRSINFITAHDGFTLHDLVSYQEKHNDANLENNRDGESHNISWNCGAEGVTQDTKILELRERQMRNFLVALMISVGTPMVLMGDEYGHTRKGNNNPWCQDSDLNWFLWDISSPFSTFYKELIQFRKKYSFLKSHHFLSSTDIVWHGHIPNKPEWGTESRFVAYTLKNRLYIAFNASSSKASITLPLIPHNGYWNLIIDTASPTFKKTRVTRSNYVMEPYSSLILEAHLI